MYIYIYIYIYICIHHLLGPAALQHAAVLAHKLSL